MSALDALMGDLTPEQRAAVEGQKPRARQTNSSKSTTAPSDAWQRANDLDSAEVGDWLGLRDGAGWKCPACESTSGFDPVRGGFKCLHDRCSDRGSEGFLSNVDMVAELRGLAPWEAVNELAARFGFDPLPERQPRQQTNGKPQAPPADDDWQPSDDDAPDAPPAGDAPRPTKDTPAVIWHDARALFAELPPPSWLVHDLQIGPGRPCLLAAYGASGKTIASQAMALAIATGTPVWDHFPARTGKIVHVDHEQGFFATARRYQRLSRGMELEPAELDGMISLATLPSLYLTSPQGVLEYERIADGASLVIIDALRGATPGCDENDSRIRTHLDTLTRISERTGAAFWLLHHAGKPKDGHDDARTVARGSSAIFDAAGCVFIMWGSKGTPKTVSQQKTPAEAEGQAVEDFVLAIEDVPLGLSPTGGVRVVYRPNATMVQPAAAQQALAELIERIRALFKVEPVQKSKDAIRAQLGSNRSATYAAVDVMITNGEVVAEGSTTNRRLRYVGTK